MKERKNIALLTGRGGSVSIKDKNIMKVLGRPLMLYPYLAARSAILIDDIYLSTDGEKLKEVARDYGIGIIDRPPDLALATSQHVDCIKHALDHLASEGIEVNIIVVFLCNVATHEIGAVDAALSFLNDHQEFDSCVAVSEMRENHPAIAKRSTLGPSLIKSFDNELHYIQPFEKGEMVLNRDEMRPCYFLTHSFWALRVESCFRGDGQPPWDFMGKKVAGYIMDHASDIHDVEDTAFAECWLQMRGWSKHDDPYETDRGLSGS